MCGGVAAGSDRVLVAGDMPRRGTVIISMPPTHRNRSIKT